MASYEPIGRNWRNIWTALLTITFFCGFAGAPAARAQFPNPLSKARERAQHEVRRRQEQAARAAQRAAEAARRAEERARQAARHAGGRESHSSKHHGGRISEWGHDRGRVLSDWGKESGGRISRWGKDVGGEISRWGHDRGGEVARWGKHQGGRVSRWGKHTGGHVSRGGKELGGRAWGAWRDHPGNVEVGRVWYRIFKKKWDRSVRTTVDRANEGLDDFNSYPPLIVTGTSMEYRQAPGGEFRDQVGDGNEPNEIVDVYAPHGGVIAHALMRRAHDGTTTIFNGRQVQIDGVFRIVQGRVRLALFDSQGNVVAAGNWVVPGGGLFDTEWQPDSFRTIIPNDDDQYMIGVQLDVATQAAVAGVAMTRR